MMQEPKATMPRVLFWPLGNPELETAIEDSKRALENLRTRNLKISAVEKMTWWEPTEIPKIARSIDLNDQDLLVIFSATHGTVRCITAVAELFNRRRKVPTIIWSIPVRYSLATSGLALSYLRERNLWVRMLCTEPSDESAPKEIESIARAAHAFAESRKKKIGLVGNLGPLMISLPSDPLILRRKLGPKTFKITEQSLDKMLRSISDADVQKQVALLKEKYPVQVKDKSLSKAARFQLAVRKFVEKNKLDGIALECWTKLFPKYGVNPCLGHLDDLTVGCEGDIVSLSGSLILKEVNGVNPYLTDILSADPKENTITLSHCAAPISMAREGSQVSIVSRTDPKALGKTAFAHFDFKKGPVTIVRFYGRKLDKIHMTYGELKGMANYWGGTSPVIESKGKTAEFLKNVCGNHYILTYGDVREEIRLFAEWSGIQIRED